MILLEDLAKSCQVTLNIPPHFEVRGFSDINAENAGSIGYAGHEKYISQLAKNTNLALIICPPNDKFMGDRFIFSNQPEEDYFLLYNTWSKQKKYDDSIIHTSANIHPNATIYPTGVTIGARTIVEPNSVIFPGVSIGEDCRIGVGTVIGRDGFMIKKISGKQTIITHDCDVLIGNDVHCGAYCYFDKGLFGHHTVVESEVCIGNHVTIGHGVSVGKCSLIVTGSIIGGFSQLEDGVYLGMHATIRPRLKLGKKSFIGMGATVVRNVAEEEHMMGDMADNSNHKMTQIHYLRRMTKKR